MVKRFSVIILCYNNSEYLKDCIDSVLMQDYSEIEIIVADDFSKSFDTEKFKKYCIENNKGNIKDIIIYRNAENVGTVRSANIAFAKASGAYFKFIGGDDQLAENRTLSNAAEALEKSLDGIITSDVLKCDINMNIIRKYPDNLQKNLNLISPEDCFARLCIHNDIIDGGVFFRKDFFEKYGLFDENYRLLDDWPTWLRVTQAGGKIEYYEFLAMKYRANAGVGTSINPVYLADKKTVLNNVIIPQRKRLGLVNYLMARMSFILINSIFIRKTYAFLVGRKN